MPAFDRTRWADTHDGGRTKTYRDTGTAVAEPPSGEAKATEAAAALAEEFGVDLATVEATGARGDITVADVRRAAGGSS